MRDIDRGGAQTFLHLFWRRQFAHVVRANFDDRDIARIVKKIRLEAWTKQILPHESGVISAAHVKSHVYNNLDDFWECGIEPRTYMAISPHDRYDTDGPSLVTALMPPRYTQPDHAHAESDEVTFYADAARVIYHRGAQRIMMDVPPYSLVRIPRNVYHTIQNPSDEPSLNMSIKIPVALRDRMEDDPTTSPSDAVARIVVPDSDVSQVRIWRVFDHGAPYEIRAFTHRDGDVAEIAAQRGAMMIFVIGGGYQVTFDPSAQSTHDRAVCASGDHVALRCGGRATFRAVGSSRLYAVEVRQEGA